LYIFFLFPSKDTGKIYPADTSTDQIHLTTFDNENNQTNNSFLLPPIAPYPRPQLMPRIPPYPMPYAPIPPNYPTYNNVTVDSRDENDDENQQQNDKTKEDTKYGIFSNLL